MAHTYEMTPELAKKYLEDGLAENLKPLYRQLRQAYLSYTAEEIGRVFGYIRAEFVLQQASDKLE